MHRRKVVHQFAVFGNWKAVLWKDAVRDTSSLAQYTKLLNKQVAMYEEVLK